MAETATDQVVQEELPKLTPKQARFVEFYLRHFNASRAAREAGYSEDSARMIGGENLTKPAIKAEIAKRLSAEAMTAEEVHQRLTRWGRSSIEPFLSRKGGISLKSEEARANLHQIKKIKVTERAVQRPGSRAKVIDRTTELELYDAKDATIQMGKILGQFVEKKEISGAGGEALVIRLVEE